MDTIDTVRQRPIPTPEAKQDTLYTVKGIVSGESIEETLPGAHIYIGTNKQPATVTDAMGEFTLTKVPKGELVITASFVGYKPTSQKFLVKADTNIGHIVLLPEILEEVTVTATPPLVTQNGDTTQFNALAVKVAEDAYLEDLLKKLPGFQIVDGKLMVKRTKVKDEIRWKDGIIDIDWLGFDELMDKLEMAFGVDIVIDRETLPEFKYTGGRLRVSDGIEYALNVLGNGADFTWSKDFRTGTIYIR